jgi:hypothetical protein
VSLHHVQSRTFGAGFTSLSQFEQALEVVVKLRTASLARASEKMNLARTAMAAFGQMQQSRQQTASFTPTKREKHLILCAIKARASAISDAATAAAILPLPHGCEMKLDSYYKGSRTRWKTR